MKNILLILFTFVTLVACDDTSNQSDTVKNDNLFEVLDNAIEDKVYNTDTGVRHLRIAGVDLWIPDNYKMGSYNSKELNQRNVLLQLLLPDFEPRTDENIHGFTKGTGFGDRLRILLDDFSQATDLNFRYAKRIELTQPHEPIENLYGFDETFRSVYPDKVILGANFYVIKNDEDIVSFIECDIGKRVKDQGCQQSFLYDNKILVKLAYSSKYLRDWKTLEKKSIALIKTFKNRPETVGIE